MRNSEKQSKATAVPISSDFVPSVTASIDRVNHTNRGEFAEETKHMDTQHNDMTDEQSPEIERMKRMQEAYREIRDSQGFVEDGDGWLRPVVDQPSAREVLEKYGLK